MKYLGKFIIVLMLSSCYYGINEKTSKISSLSTTCIADTAWQDIQKHHAVDSTLNANFIAVLKEFEDQPFSTEIWYFDKDPQELIGISDNHYLIRYVYNPKISRQVLNGLSPQLSDAEKKRIRKRVLSLLMNYQCEEGKAESMKIINSPDFY